MAECSNCGQDWGRLVRGRCNTCYRFHKRTGRDRDPDLIRRTNTVRLEHELAVPYGLQALYQAAARRYDETHRPLQTTGN